MTEKTRVIVAGALGRMGAETVKAILQDKELLLTAAVDIKARGETVSDITGLKGFSVTLENDLEKALEETKPQVLVDFTNPQAVFNNVRRPVKGTGNRIHLEESWR
jgi:4-hydroxy-tetrahydrodipicolinate reductase